MITATRFHDFSAGHRVVGHENKCAQLHGHNYRVHFTVQGELDKVGRVLDFSVIKSKLCDWLEENWDHKFLVWTKDPWVSFFKYGEISKEKWEEQSGIVQVTFNPTAENMARHLVLFVGPIVLAETGAELIKVVVEETRKCSATFEKEK